MAYPASPRAAKLDGPAARSDNALNGGAVLAEAGLAFLELGAQPPTPSWGQMLSVAQGYISMAPWLAYWPGLAIFIAVMGFNLIGDGVREALDPPIGP